MDRPDLVDFFFCYFVIGAMAMFIPGYFGYSVAECLAVGAFWPLFAIKYIVIGLWIVVSSGFTLLIGV